MIHPLIALERRTIIEFVASCADEVRLAMPQIAEDADPEWAHRFRVALRRLRGTFKALHGHVPIDDLGTLSAECAWFFGRSGPLRDHDVLLESLEGYLADVKWPDEVAVERLRREFQRGRARARRALLNSCNSQRAGRLLERLSSLSSLELHHPEWADQQQAPVLLDRSYRRLASRVRELGADSAPEQVHALRKFAKRMRYLLELYEPVYPKGELAATRAGLRKLQDLLGTYQDLDTHGAILRQLLEKAVAATRLNQSRIDLLEALLVAMDARAAKTRRRIHKRLDKVFTDEAVKSERKRFRTIRTASWPLVGIAGYCHALDGKRSKLPLGKLVCAGRNYAEHATELGNAVPEKPLLFFKPAAAMVDFAGQIAIPSAMGQVHYELEIAVLLKRRLHRATVSEARRAIAGLGLGLDLTFRDVQSQLKKNGQPWEQAKAFDGACPLTGFVSVPRDFELDNLCLRLDINGERRQLATSAEMITPICELIAYASEQFTLWPGDVVLTGTPKGVGQLHAGDQLDAELYGVLNARAGILSRVV